MTIRDIGAPRALYRSGPGGRRRIAHSKILSARAALALGVALAVYAVPALAANKESTDKKTAAAGVDETPATANRPVTFLADRVSYDKVNGLVTAEGHVQAWQNDHYLSADRVTFDRNTDVAAAHGHVLIVEPDGEIVFGDYAELSQGMKNGVITGMRALLQGGGKVAANGARRTEGKLNEMARAVYSACNVCALDPDRSPEWDLRADHTTQDLENKRIEFSDAWLDFYGIPAFYLPYMSIADPSVKRQTGFLVPTLGYADNHLGTFFAIPYYIVLDDQSDMTLTPNVNTGQGGQLGVEYRRDFNEGVVKMDGAIAQDQKSLAGYVFTSANFEWNDTLRYGANINLASSTDYLRDYFINDIPTALLTSNVYLEGFGVGAYTRLDMSVYQGLNSSINSSTLPYVLPRYTYSFFGEPNILGGRVYFDTQDFNVIRPEGTATERAGVRLGWDRTLSGPLGDQWLFTVQATGEAFQARNLDQEPNYGLTSNATGAHAEPQVAVKLNWPFVRDAGSWGTQILEPIVQLIAGPQTGNSLHDNIPNEDSLDYEFTDSTLFSLNRYGGYDRYDGGMRANFALHGNWIFLGGQSLDTLLGASAIEHVDHNLYPEFQPWNGFNQGSHLSDVIGRATFAPNKWVDFTARARVDHTSGDLRFAEAVTSFGPRFLRMNLGYLWTATNPYDLYTSDYYQAPYLLVPSNPNQAGFFSPRDEISAGIAIKQGGYAFAANARRDLATGQMDSLNAHFSYQDECTIYDFIVNKRYTSLNGDKGEDQFMLMITLKTLGKVSGT